MGKARFALVWAFIFLVASYDGYFAWHYRAVFAVWEQNPLACWAVEHVGLPAVLAFKFLSLSFAATLALYCHDRRRLLEYPITVIIGCAYGLLLLHYAAGHQQIHGDPFAGRIPQLAHLSPR
jgi:hypothetical protein